MSHATPPRPARETRACLDCGSVKPCSLYDETYPKDNATQTVWLCDRCIDRRLGLWRDVPVVPVSVW